MIASRSNGAAGFTLVELVLAVLVGLAVIAVVAPAVRLAVVESPRAACIEHLQELGQAHFSWASDYNGWLVLNPRNLDGSPVYSGPFLTTQRSFKYQAVDLGTQDYVANPQIWVCPADRFDGPADNISVTPTTVYGPSFNGYQNISYLYLAGYNTLSTSEDPSTAPVMSDESNEIENGAAVPSTLPDLDAADNHGAAYRNVLYLDGHVAGISGTNAVNAFLPTFVDPFILQFVD